jgi:hypothetical protein
MFRTLLKIITLSLLVALPAHAEHATDQAPVDNRINLNLTAGERAVFLAEMRQMLGSIQGVVQGIGGSDRNRIAESARLSGNRMARATPVTVRAKLPQSFRDIGGPTHMMFEELAIRAETDDMDMLARDAGKLMNQCMICHAKFRVR